MNVVELYFTFTCLAHPILKRAKFEFFVMNCLQSFSNGSKIIEIPSNEFGIVSEGDLKCMYAFYLSSLTLAEQLLGQLAQPTARKCESFLAALSLDYNANFFYVGACQHLALFYSGYGEISKTRYYSLLAGFYFSENENKSLE